MSAELFCRLASKQETPFMKEDWPEINEAGDSVAHNKDAALFFSLAWCERNSGQPFCGCSVCHGDSIAVPL